ncbi:MAG: hypothetical protein R3343_00315 [Nitriliruptorales bacterium]|nr:hypothetical protein [Nitriliruptorales bacterium]
MDGEDGSGGTGGRLRQWDDALIARLRGWDDALIDRLWNMDSAVVPRLQRRARRVTGFLGRPFRAVRRWEDRSWFRVVARHRAVLAFLAVAIATAASAVHFDRYPDLLEARAEARAAAERQAIRVPGSSSGGEGSELAGGGTYEIGPPVGGDVDAYIADRHQELADLAADDDRPLVAVVSFAGYLEPEAVLSILPEGTTVRLAQYRIPAESEPPLETEVVGGDLVASIDRIIETELGPIRAEASEVEKLIESGTVQDEEYQADYERRLSELKTVENVLETGAPVVFAVVVEGAAGPLRDLVDHEDVRLVDPAPGETDIDGSAFFGLRPDDTDEVTYGRDV